MPTPATPRKSLIHGPLNGIDLRTLIRINYELLIFYNTDFSIHDPGWESTLGGFPALSAPVGQFLLKDIVLLGAAVFTASEAFAAVSAPEMGSE